MVFKISVGAVLRCFHKYRYPGDRQFELEDMPAYVVGGPLPSESLVGRELSSASTAP
jgi:hypothetical protein